MRQRREGFTLLELIVVITIIGIMGTFVVVRVSGMTYKAKVAKIKTDMSKIRQVAEGIEAQTGSWPQSIEECVNPPESTSGESVAMTLTEYPKDPWANDYIYDLQDKGPVISCLGKDGAEGGENEDQDYYHPEQQDY